MAGGIEPKAVSFLLPRRAIAGNVPPVDHDSSRC